MADTMQMTSPRTHAARKAPSTSISPLKLQSSKSALAAGTKRKIKTEVMSPTQASPKNKKAGSGAPVAQMVPDKKQKVHHEDEDEMEVQGHNASSPLQGQTHLHMPTPFQTPAQSPQPASNNGQKLQEYAKSQTGANSNPQMFTASNGTIIVFGRLLHGVFHNNPTLLPSSPSETITSTHIDSIAYKMWATALSHGTGALLDSANKYSAMLNEVKLRTLARLNFLPSWWFLREQVVHGLRNMNRPIDDSVMMLQWKAAGASASRIMDGGAKARAAKEENEDKHIPVEKPNK